MVVSKSQNTKIKHFILYTVLFLTAFGMNFFTFIKTGSSFIWSFDGASQHFPALYSIGEFYRELFSNITHGIFSIPTYDTSMMLGADRLVTLNYYGLGDPLTILSAFVPLKYTEVLFNALIVLRFYFAGLSFLFLCRYYRKEFTPSLCGAFIYIFCGYATCFAIRHPFFLNPLIQFPLLIVGADQILKENKSKLFSLAVCYSALCGFYFTYMMSLLLVIFVAIRFFDYKENLIKKFFVFVKYYGVGILMSAVIFLPSLLGFLNNSDRSGMEEGGMDLLYDKAYYIQKIGRLIAPCGSENILALSAIVIFGILLLFFRKKEGKRTLLLLLIACLIIYSVPLFGSALNGFSYSSNRWTFAFALLLSFLTVEAIPKFLDLKKEGYFLCFTFVLFVCGFEYFAYKASYWKGYSIKYSLIFLVGFFLLLTVGLIIKTPFPKIFYVVCLVFIMVNTAINTNVKYSELGQNTISEYTPFGTALLNASGEACASAYLSDEDFYRVGGTTLQRNQGLLYNLPGFTGYFSISNAFVSTLWNETQNADIRSDFNIYGTDQHTILSTLLSGKYDIEPVGVLQYPPFGYTHVADLSGFSIYENEYALPLGYTYDHASSLETLENYNGLEKEQALLSTVFFDESDVAVTDTVLKEDDSFVSTEVMTPNVEHLSLEVVAADGVEVIENGFVSTKENATIALAFDLPENTEGYLSLTGGEISKENGDSVQTDITVSCDGYSSVLRMLSKNHVHYTGKSDYLCNLGYTPNGHALLTLTFDRAETLTYESLDICYQDFSNYEKEIANRKEDVLSNVSMEGNKIKGNCDVSENKILVLSLPYERGWSATVDGKNATLLRANYMFLSLPLEKGNHTIELSYHTLGLRLGFLLSIIGFVLFFFLCKKEKKH